MSYLSLVSDRLVLTWIVGLVLIVFPFSGRISLFAAEPTEIDFFDNSAAMDDLSMDEARRLLRSVPGERREISQREFRDRKITRFEGTFQLNVSWPKDAALRMVLFQPIGTLEMHFWRGRNGLTLGFHRMNQSWSVYRTTREASSSRKAAAFEPSTRALMATDGGRFRRSGAGAFQCHYYDGQFVMSRGDLRLLSVPFEGPPESVYLVGSGLLGNVKMIDAPPPVPENSRAQDPGKVLVPARLDWKPHADQTDADQTDADQTDTDQMLSMKKLSDGGMEMTAQPDTPKAWCVATVDDPGLMDVRFELEAPDVGTGLCLADAEGVQRIRVGFYQFGPSDQRLLKPGDPNANESSQRVHFMRQPIPFVGRRVWVRIVAGAGIWKYWVSGDGVHWSQPEPWSSPYQGKCSKVGLSFCRTAKRRSIRLRALKIRRFEAIESVVPKAIRQRVELPKLIESSHSIKDWEAAVAGTRPTDVAASIWWRACAVESLSSGLLASVSQSILARLAERVLAEPSPVDSRLEFLKEVALLWESADPNHHDAFQRVVQQFGRALLAEGHAHPFRTLHRSILRSPYWSGWQFSPFDEDLFRHELVDRVASNDWGELSQWIRRTNYWLQGFPDRPQKNEGIHYLIDWAEKQSPSARPKPASPRPPAVVQIPPHPFIEQWNKEGFNLFSELESALQAKAYREACEIVVASAESNERGIFPDPSDPRLSVSLPVTIRAAMRQYPAFHQTAQTHFGPLSEVRWKRAAASGNAREVAKVAAQFFGTTASADALGWLGDRHVSAGRFANAAMHYERAMQYATTSRKPNLQARWRLAAAMVGRDVGQPPSVPVTIGTERFSPEQFEHLIDELRPNRSSASNQRPASICPTPRTIEPKKWAELDGARIARPFGLPDQCEDWAGRQIGLAISQRQLFVNNQVDQMAFDLATGRQDWSQRNSVSESRQQWPTTAMTPVLRNGRVYVRRLSESGPELACLIASHGKLVWSCQPGELVASDPIFLGEKLFVLATIKQSGNKLALLLVEIDVETGRFIDTHSVAELHDLFGEGLTCRAAVSNTKIVVTGAGCLFCFNAEGQLEWLRRQFLIPRPVNRHHLITPWLEQEHGKPLVGNGRVFATQPGVWNVECVDLRSGRLDWRRPVSRLTRLVALTEKLLIVQASDGLVAMNRTDGALRWTYDAQRIKTPQVCERMNVVFHVRLESATEGSTSSRLLLEWLDLATGKLKGRTVLDLVDVKDPLWGPMIGRNGQTWGFTTSKKTPTKRTILKMVPSNQDNQ